MKKTIITGLIGSVICLSSYGFTSCISNNTYFLMLKPAVNGTSKESSNTGKIWKVVFDYITLTGFAACNEISGTANTAKTNLVTNSEDEGTYCWCKMWPVEDYDYETGPTSYWMYLDSYGTDADCASGCASACATAVKDNTTFRTRMFESMW